MVEWLVVRRALVGAVLVVLALAVAVGAARLLVVLGTRARMFAIERVPPRPVAIVFGAGVGSAMLADRVAVGVALYRTGKVRKLLLSGDNRQRSYDEPRAMRRLALEAGVPAADLVLDYAGRRTYDSCARARSIFQLDDAVLVTQQFHLPRALYLCAGLGLPRVVGVAADRRAYGARSWNELREVLASVRALLDLHLRRPRYVGGPTIPIPTES